MIRVETCPKTPEDVKRASKILACGNDIFEHNQYMCLPNVEKTSLVEFCHNGIMGILEEGIKNQIGKVISDFFYCSFFQSNEALNTVINVNKI